MYQSTYSLTEQLTQQIAKLPWQTHTISLLLDGINVKNLLHRFYTQNNTSTFEVLYLQTPFAQLYDISPCLVKLDNINNPHLQAYLNNLADDWGYILISDQTWQQQIDHLRNLILVQSSRDEEPTILKIADPLVAKSLFGLAQNQEDTQFFGAFTQIYTTDIIDNQLDSYQRPTDKHIVPLTLPYQLSKAQDEQLDKVETKRNNHKLYLHMQQYFPTFLANHSEPDKKQIICNLIQEAENKGYTTPMEQTYYLNIHGYLGNNVLQEHPNIFQLVQQQTLQSLQKAAELAKTIASH